MKLAAIAEALGGVLEGDGSISIDGLAGLSEAEPGQLSFLASDRYAAALALTRASAVVVPHAWTGPSPVPVIRVDNPDAAFARAATLLVPPPPGPDPGIHPTAVVAADAVVAPSVSIGPGCVVESGVRVGANSIIGPACVIGRGAVIGAGSRLMARVTVYHGCRVGDRAILHAGVVIGSDGFGYVQADGTWEKIPQVGIVEIGNDVEIGANSTIDRARVGRTVIGDGVKIDNLVQVAHNCVIGDHTAIAALVGIAGSTTIGRGVQIGGQAGVTGHVRVGDGAVIAGQAGVTKDVPAGVFVSGFPAIPHREALKQQAHVSRLPGLAARVAALEKRGGD